MSESKVNHDAAVLVLRDEQWVPKEVTKVTHETDSKFITPVGDFCKEGENYKSDRCDDTGEPDRTVRLSFAEKDILEASKQKP